MAEKMLRRSGWILFLAYAFRFEQAAVWYPYSQWDQIWKVDILNCLALSSIAVGLIGVLSRDRTRLALIMGGSAAAIVLVTPWVFLLRGGLWMAYLNGAGHPNYFMFFSWGAFAFAGAATGSLLLEARARGREERFMLLAGGAGVLAFALGFEINKYPVAYGFFDYSLTSPQYFLVRLGYMLMFLYAAYRWSTRRTANRWSPLIVFGQTSLLVYWVHIEFVYGRLRLFHNSLGIAATATQLLWLIPLMLALAVWRLKSIRASAERSRGATELRRDFPSRVRALR